MSNEIKELVERLREGSVSTSYADKAADALEAMAEKLQRETKAAGYWMERFCASENERDSLKAALQDCVDAYDFVMEDEYDRGWSSVSDAIHFARKALEGKE